MKVSRPSSFRGGPRTCRFCSRITNLCISRILEHSIICSRERRGNGAPIPIFISFYLDSKSSGTQVTPQVFLRLKYTRLQPFHLSTPISFYHSNFTFLPFHPDILLFNFHFKNNFVKNNYSF